MSNEKMHIESNTVQETLVIPLWGRKYCSEIYPEIYQDQTAKKIMEKLLSKEGQEVIRGGAKKPEKAAAEPAPAPEAPAAEKKTKSAGVEIFADDFEDDEE